MAKCSLLPMQFSDGHYTSALIDALATTITPMVAMSVPQG